MTQLTSHYHVGIVVPDVAAAQAELSEQLGLTWGPVMHLDSTDLRDVDGQDLALPTTICFSLEAPHLELIEEVPGSVWVCNPHSNLHHIGFWSDDLPGDSAHLAGSGCPLQLCGRDATTAPSQFAYHAGGLGVRVEVVDAGLREAMSFLFTPPTA
ncbi:MAG: VOC family protein [Acidimicrobiales bacterium]